MRKRLLSFLFVCVLIVTLPLSALASTNSSSVEDLVKKGVIPASANFDADVTKTDFLEYALTALTYQHGSASLRAEIASKWIKKGELENSKLPVTKEEVSRILVRALELDTVEKTLADYKATADKLGLFKEVSQQSNYVTSRQLAVIFENYKTIQNKDNDNKGVKELVVEDFFKSPGSFGYQLSPDGNYLSYLSAWENRRNVFVKKMGDDSKPVRVTSSKDRDIMGVIWKDNQLLYTKDKGGDENYHLFSSSFNGAIEKELTPYPKARVGVLDTLKGIKDEILITMNKDNPTVFDVYKLNIKTTKLTHVAKNPGNIVDWLTDHKGNIRLAVQSDGIEGVILYRESDKDSFKPFIKMNGGDEVRPIVFSKDNKYIYALSNKGRDKTAFVKFDLKGKEEVLYSHPDVDVLGAAYDATRDKLLFGAYMTDKIHFTFFDDSIKHIYQSLQEKLKVTESELGIVDSNSTMTKFIVAVSSDTVFGKYYYYDSTKNELTELATLSPWLDPDNMAEMHPISYKSRDGLTINGYLTLPKNRKAENLPLIVNPHGGPWARDIWMFNPEVQLLANKGYAVLQMNFRSSTGYGKEFLNAGNKQWGLKIQDDITDGVQWAIKQEIANPKKIGIYGASFGGYATLAGITFTPDLYAAAVDYVGVSNIFTLLDTIPPYWETMRKQFYERVGDPEKDKELLMAASPVFHADKIKTPLFVAQGANDPRVNKNESDQIVKALRDRGVDVTYMLKENEGHGFANIENQLDFYTSMLQFLDKHLK